MRLFLWECRRIAKSLVYWLFVAAMVGFLVSQDVVPCREGDFSRPQPGDEQNVLVPSGDHALIMEEAAQALLAAWQENSFTTYPLPLSVVRHVRLNDAKYAELGGVLQALYGTSAAELPQAGGGYTMEFGQATVEADGSLSFSPPQAPAGAQAPALRDGLAWEEFCALMDQADRILGGGSDWQVAALEQAYGKVPAQYEDLLREYETSMAQDRYTGAYARLFCDYAVIALALFGAFPAVALFLQDRKGTAAAVYARRCGSPALACARFGALAFLQILPLLVLGALLTVQYAGLYGWGAIAPLAFLRYTLLWLLPTLLLEVAAAMALTIGTGTPAAAAVMPVLGWLSVLQGVTGLSNGSTYASLLTPRHNVLGGYLVYQQNLPQLLVGRGLACLAAAVLLLAAVRLLDANRKGVPAWDGFSLLPKRS